MDPDYASVHADTQPKHGPKSSWVPQPTEAVLPKTRSSSTIVVSIILLFVIVLLALLPRLAFLYIVSDPDIVIPSWSNDTWHRWQIAYLSKEIGMADGLRLWDLKGMEYYWGILHPFLTAGLFETFGTVDVMVLRWLTMIAGVFNIVFLFCLARRYWGVQVAFAVAMLAALNPIAIFNDPSGMVEPLGFMFLLAGILCFPRRAGLAGVLWALAAMSRAEAWLLSAGLIAAAMLSKEDSYNKLALGLGWGVPILFYMKYLLDRTGNAIYPIYWNFLANAAGKWEFREGFTSYQLQVRPVLAVLFVLCLLGAVWALLKRPKGYLVYLLGFGVSAFISGFIGLTYYLKSYEPWFWLTRFFVFPYLFFLLLAAVFLLGWLPDKIRLWKILRLGTVAVLVLLAATQLIWPAILIDVNEGYTSRTSISNLRVQGEFIDQYYTEGTVLIPEGIPQFTYAIGRYSSVPAQSILGQMYGPIYYYEGENPLQNWETIGPQMWDWFESKDVRLLVMQSDDQSFIKMIEERPERFVSMGTVPNSALLLYEVILE